MAAATSWPISRIHRARPLPKWLVSPIQAFQQLVQRHPALVPRLVLPPQTARPLVLPLVRVIEVDSHHVEIVGTTAELRLGGAGEHVPRLELALSVLFRLHR